MLVLLALILLLASISAGYLLWVRPRESRLDLQGKVLLLFVLLTLAGAFWGTMPWWFDDQESFSWNLPPLASRMLGAAAFSFVVAGFLTLSRPTTERVRLILLMDFVYLVPLTLAILAFHTDRFDYDEPVVWGFFPLVVLMCSMSTYFLLKTPDLSEDAGVAVSLPALLKGWFLAVAVVTALWGLALFATDDGASELVWAWPGDLLSSRLIASMLLTIAATAVYGVLYPRTATMALAVIATYGIAGALANVWQDFLDKPVKEGYVVVLGVMGVVSLVTLFVRTVQSPRDAEPQPSAAD